MLHTTIELNIDYEKAGITHSGDKATLTTYILDHDDVNREGKTRKLILICPGGGYSHLSFREGEPIAMKMNSMGYNACILRYSLTPNKFPTQLIEAAYCVRYIREHAAEWHVDPDEITIAGFSAGAHVAGSLGCIYKDDRITTVLGGDFTMYKPNRMLLCYPVITAGEFAHRGSFNCLVGENNTEMYDEVSLEKRVNEDTVPTFIWHTFADAAVPVENSLLMAMSLRKYKIPCELHIFQNGCHGLALATEETNTSNGKTIEPECTVWPELFDHWINL